MSSDLQRQDSLRTVLRNQKRRLSATERKQSSPDLTGGNGERKSPFSLRSTPSRSHRGTPTKSERGTPTRSTCTPPRLSKYIKRAINSLIMSGLVIQLFAWGTLGGGQAFDWRQDHWERGLGMFRVGPEKKLHKSNCPPPLRSPHFTFRGPKENFRVLAYKIGIGIILKINKSVHNLNHFEKCISCKNLLSNGNRDKHIGH